MALDRVALTLVVYSIMVIVLAALLLDVLGRAQPLNADLTRISAIAILVIASLTLIYGIVLLVLKSGVAGPAGPAGLGMRRPLAVEQQTTSLVAGPAGANPFNSTLAGYSQSPF